MSTLKKIRPITWIVIVCWLALVTAVYYYVYSAGWLNSAIQATNEMTRFQSSLLEEQGVDGASVSIHNFYASGDDGEDRRTLSVVLNGTDVCTVDDDACKEFMGRIATKALEEYPEIDSFTHLNIGVQQKKKILLIINFSRTFNDSKTIEEWRDEVQEE